MIRFGAVLTVVLAAMGLLIGGVLTNSLPLVYLSIALAALAAVMLAVGVVIWRGEVFGEAPAGRAASASPAEPAREAVASASPLVSAALTGSLPA